MSDLWFTPRLTIPNISDLNWINQGSGGYNIYGAGYPQRGPGNVLSNCTGYAWGRWREILGYNHSLPMGNGGNWYAYNTTYAEGQTPKLGCVACWGGPNVDGHVAIVEQIFYNSDNSVNYCIVSQSGWGWSDYFRTRQISPSNNWWIYNDVGTFQGFIYLPVDFLPCPINFKSRKKLKVRLY